MRVFAPQGRHVAPMGVKFGTEGGGVLEVVYHRAKFGGARISPGAGVAKNVEFFCLSVCLSVCLFVTLLNIRDCAPDFAMKSLEYRNDFDTVG